MRLLIAIPVFNERHYVAGVLDQVRRYHKDILVIDDGSTDGTGDLLQALAAKGKIRLIHHAANRGYGQSLIDAFNYAAAHEFDWIITMDCDEQHEPKMIPEFIRHIDMDDADIISGSRYLQPRRQDDPPPPDRRHINQILTKELNERFDLGLTDAFCGYKAHRVSAMSRLCLTVPGYAFPMQLWPQVAAAGLIVKEIPVRLIYNDPNRYFGGALDDPDNRLRHYHQVLQDEIERVAVGTCSCCCC